MEVELVFFSTSGCIGLTLGSCHARYRPAIGAPESSYPHGTNGIYLPCCCFAFRWVLDLATFWRNTSTRTRIAQSFPEFFLGVANVCVTLQEIEFHELQQAEAENLIDLTNNTTQLSEEAEKDRLSE